MGNKMTIQHIGLLGVLVLLILLGILELAQVGPPRLYGAVLIMSTVIGSFLFLKGGFIGVDDDPLLQERQIEAQRLRAARERERAFYDLATTLSSTLDYQKILEAVQDVGQLVTDVRNSNSRIVSAAFLFHDDTGRLHVANGRGLNFQDLEKTTEGQQGVLGLALRQSEPVFATFAKHDPELQYFSAFQECKSVLAVPLRANFDYYGVLVFGSMQQHAFSEDYVELVKAIGTQATIALQNAVLYQNVMNEKERIVEVEEDARKKLARNLHDGPTQSIAAIAMRVNYVRRLVEKENEQAYAELGRIEDLARRTTKEIRHMLFTLRPLILETQGLVAALGQLAEKMKDTHDINVLIEAQQGVERWLDTHAQGVVFYIVEEAVNNAYKHAQSGHIWVRLYQQESLVVVEIEDDGVGFDQSSVEAGRARNSLGMVTMRERSELVSGSLHVESEVGSGTKISIVMSADTLSAPPSMTMPAESKKKKSTAATSTEESKSETPSQPQKPNKSKTPIPYATKRSPSV